MTKSPAEKAADEMTDEELRVAIAEWCGYTRLLAGALVSIPPRKSEVVCGACKAVLRVTGSYNWQSHEHCGPSGGLCAGGDWALFASVWVDDNNQAVTLPNYPADLNAMWLAEETLKPERNATETTPWGQYFLLGLLRFAERNKLPVGHLTAKHKAIVFVETIQNL